jgi:hypothetical protein
MRAHQIYTITETIIDGDGERNRNGYGDSNGHGSYITSTAALMTSTGAG